MSVAVTVPVLGESVVEGTVARWLVSEGDFVEQDQIIVELTTDKVDVEIPTPCAGRVEKILVAVDETVEVGAELVRLDPDAEGEAVSASSGKPEEPAAHGVAAESPPVPVREDGAKLATPLARRVAEAQNVDLGQVEGTGAAGRIRKDDVLRSETSPSPPRAAPSPPRAAPSRAKSSYGVSLDPGDRVVPMSRLRKLVADHMVYSKRTSPHVGTVAEIDMTNVVRLRSAQKGRFEEVHGVPLTFLPFIVHATVRALRENPALNASVVDDSIVEKRSIHLGIAVETDKGLVVPVIRDADRLSLAGLAAAIEELSSRARTKKLKADDLRGGTFTLSNPGRKGNLYGFAIINQPQVGILRMGEMVRRPVVRSLEGEDAIVIRSMMHLALSYDHRAVDGAPANAFLFQIRELLEAADFDL